MGNEQGKPGGPTPAGIQTMDESLQKKFSKGIQYNMKIVIRGDRNAGKTTLFHRMEGKPFNEAYIPTNEIQVTSILWSYRVTNDTVKVEIWDTVDKARSQSKDKGKGSGLKMFNAALEEVEVAEENGNGNGGQALDASFLDVYKGAHGVVFIFDIIKQWTWKYVERELPRVPLHVPVIVLANFCDMCEHRLITREDCIMAIKYLDRPEGAAEIRYAECSLKNGFGLMHLHKFLSVPFLQLQQETLLQQLQVNREQMMAAMEELNTAVDTEDQNYTKYLAKMERLSEEKKRRIMMARLQQEQQEHGNNHQSEADVSTSTTTRQSQPATPPTKHSTTHAESRSHIHQEQQPQGEPQAPPPPTTAVPPPQRSNSLASRFSSKLSGFLSKKEEDKPPETSQEPVQAARSRPRVASKTDIEEFVPEGEGVDDFLSGEDEDEEDEEEDDSDDDSSAGNPMIAGDEDLSSLDEAPVVAPPTKDKATPTIVRANKQISFSDSESADEQPVAILTPIQAPVPAKPSNTKSKPPPKQLKSARDIELTESEEEDERPEIMAEEDFDFDDKKEKTIAENRDEIFEPSPPALKKKQAGLMLQFDPSITSPPATVTVPSGKSSSKQTKEAREDFKDSPSSDSRRGEKKKRKSKKSKHRHKEEEEGKEPVKKVEEPANVSMSGDPYGAIASLDAWLNSTSDDVPTTEVLTPVPAAGLTEIGTEEGVDNGGGETKTKKAKKHKHRKNREADEEGEERTSSSSKKKQRSHHKSSRHRRLEQDD